MSLTISIVTPSFNQGRFHQETLDSVLQQSYSHVEHLVIDNRSYDQTIPILQHYGDDRLHWVSESDNGQADAINKGMQQATGDILAYLNSDDMYLEDTLAFVANYFAENPDVMVLHGDCIRINATGQTLGVMKSSQYTMETAFSKQWQVLQPAMFWRREVMDAIGLFDENIILPIDYDYWLRMLLAQYQPVYIPRVLAAFRVHRSSKSNMQYENFFRDWHYLLKKIYRQDNLPTIVADMREHFMPKSILKRAQKCWIHRDYDNARPIFARVLSKPAPTKLKVASLPYYFDTFVQVSRLWQNRITG